jgi:hypothetical protein
MDVNEKVREIYILRRSCRLEYSYAVLLSELECKGKARIETNKWGQRLRVDVKVLS